MAALYDVDVRTINEHIKKIYSDSELEEDSTIRNFRIVQTEGSRQVTRDTKHYNLQMIIAVGFKVNNERAVQFRKWANGIVKDYTIKGWVMDDERLKNGGSVLTVEYFDRLLEQIREIRLSERRFYQKITDIYATALDYDRTAKTTKQFFAKVQNKMHCAVHRHTVAELIYERAGNAFTGAYVGDEFGFCHFALEKAYGDIKIVDLTIADDKSYEQLNHMLTFYIVLKDETVILDSGFVQKVCCVGFLEQGIADVFLIAQDFVGGACVPLFSSCTGKDTVMLQSGGNLIHAETF